MVAIQLNNYVTQSRARVKANKNAGRDEFIPLLTKAKERLASTGFRSAKANLNGIVVELITNSEHQYSFWSYNWWQVDSGILPHAQIYSVVGLDRVEPSAYYYPPTNTALFVNTEYYGQCKSWALGMAAAILEKRFNTLSIHGATALYKDRGVVIIAPTGTGKTTQSFKIFQSKHGKICGDDWAYVSFPDSLPANSGERLIAKQPERALYMRSETEREQGWLRRVFDRSMNENVTTRKEDCEYPEGNEMCSLTHRKCVFDSGEGWCYYAFGNSRTLVRREDLLGPEKVVNEVPINLVVLLRRDNHSPAEVKLTPDRAIELLRKGEYMVLPGAGPKEKWGTISYEPWYNPYLLELDNARQEYFFRAMFENWHVPCVILNTGVENIEQTHARIVENLESA
jgi:hypothetical protein